MNIQVTPASRDDRAALFGMWRRYVMELSVFMASGGSTSDEGVMDYWLAGGDGRIVLRITADGRMVGFCVVRTSPQPSPRIWRGGGAEYELAELYLEPAVRRTRVAVTSMAAVGRALPGRWLAYVLVGNVRAASFTRGMARRLGRLCEECVVDTSVGPAVRLRFEIK